MLTEHQQRLAAKKFAQTWANKGFEKGESQPFWLALLRDVFGVKHPENYIKFEEQVHLDHASFIDGHIPATKVLIEQKSLGKDLNAPIRQSDGSLLTPFQQAKRYITELPLSAHPRWVITCNFSTFYVYDMERPHGEPEVIELKNLSKEFYRLQFLVDKEKETIRKEMEVSIKAGDIVGQLYDALLAQYLHKEDPHALKSLNILCVRLVFCLYAEDAGLFGKKSAFHDYLAQLETRHLRDAIIKLFEVLNTKPAERDPYLDEELAAFPYVNGGLFADSQVEIPQFTEEIRTILLQKASEGFDWSEISPTIFGAVFESTLNPETRRKGGMHYTSVENIHKVIDPLFLNDLKTELDEILRTKQPNAQRKKLELYQHKLASLTFLDPACGSGNFLTETYLALRKLENKALSYLQDWKDMGAIFNPVQVSIKQCYGIEINDFAVSVAKTALWIAESQMLKATEDIVGTDLDFFPLKTYPNIVEGNALRTDWNSVISKDKLNYIMGNPPFVGARLMDPTQKDDVLHVFGKDWKNVGNLDYVCCWYKKAADFMHNTSVRAALVSTNSVTQGEQVAILWKPLFEGGLHFDFAHPTFRWDSEASLKAHVHCVIIGFSYAPNPKEKIIFTLEKSRPVKQINGYLLSAPDIYVQNRSTPLSNIPLLHFGSMPNDGGFLLLTKKEKDEILLGYPQTAKYIKTIKGAIEFIQNKPLYCLWLVQADPTELRTIPPIKARIEHVREHRLQSKRKGTITSAETPSLFAEIRQPTEPYIAIPKVSSEKRKYIPMAYEHPNVIAKDQLFVLPGATLYHFGVLQSNVHNAWVRIVCGRLKSDYNYSKSLVYNNFPWPTPTEMQKQKIEKTAQVILDARALYPNASLADLYDDLTMPAELRKAHQTNDRAVMEAYGLPKNSTESAIVSHLMQLYQALTTQ